jgi:hypothetical protein
MLQRSFGKSSVSRTPHRILRQYPPLASANRFSAIIIRTFRPPRLFVSFKREPARSGLDSDGDDLC